MTLWRPLSFLGMAAHEFRIQVITATASLVVAIVLIETVRDSTRWALAFPAVVFLGATLWGWVQAHARLRALGDIPLSRIGTAAQGYARLEGRAASFPGHPVFSPGRHLECCWFSHEVFERDEEDRNTVYHHEETSVWSFAMKDGSGECVVDPAGARVVPVHVHRWTEGRFRHIERLILPGEPVLVVGEFSTASDAVLERDIDLQVGELVAQWKKDMPALKRRFDLSGDGEFSAQEWQLVRSAARREVRADLATRPPRAQNLLARPRDDRPFMISTQSGDHLERDLRIWAWIHLVLFLGGVLLLADWLFRR